MENGEGFGLLRVQKSKSERGCLMIRRCSCSCQEKKGEVEGVQTSQTCRLETLTRHRAVTVGKLFAAEKCLLERLLGVWTSQAVEGQRDSLFPIYVCAGNLFLSREERRSGGCADQSNVQIPHTWEHAKRLSVETPACRWTMDVEERNWLSIVFLPRPPRANCWVWARTSFNIGIGTLTGSCFLVCCSLEPPT
jgi:hypothetical protein